MPSRVWLSEQFKNYKTPVVGEIVECCKCGRRLLVERALNGTDHTLKISVTCCDCLDAGGLEKVRDFYHFDKIELGAAGVH